MAVVVLTGEELWSKVQTSLQDKLSKPTFEAFVRPTGCGGFANGELRLLAPNPFAGVRLREQLLPTIADLASGVCGRPVEVVVLADSAMATPAENTSEPLQPPNLLAHASTHHPSRRNFSALDSAPLGSSSPPRSLRSWRSRLVTEKFAKRVASVITRRFGS